MDPPQCIFTFPVFLFPLLPSRLPFDKEWPEAHVMIQTGIAAAEVPNRIIGFSALILILFFRQTNLLLRFLPPVAQLFDSSVISLQLLFLSFFKVIVIGVDLQHGAV